MLRGARSAVSTAFRGSLRGSLASATRYNLYSTLQGSIRAPVAYQQSLAAPIIRNRTLLAATRSYGGSRVVEEPAVEVDYNQVKKLVDHPDPNVVLVDVREPGEYESGHIPNSVNIPFKSMPGALGLDAAEFESTLGFKKPDPNKTLLFYCLGGVRSTSSEQLASTYGYNNRMNYKGSYEDWLKHEGPKQDVNAKA